MNKTNQNYFYTVKVIVFAFLFKELQRWQDEAYSIVKFYEDDKFSELPYNLRCPDVLGANTLDFIHMAMVTFTYQMKATVEQRRTSDDKLHRVVDTYNMLVQ